LQELTQFRQQRERGVDGIDADEHSVVHEAMVIMVEYTDLKLHFPNAIITIGRLRKAWKRAEEVMELCVDIRTESRNYVCRRPP
jgi:hypothetical protein